MSIQIESLSYTYMENTPLSHTALHDVSLTIAEGSFTAIAGETGAGKSTLMQLIGGLLVPTAGRVCVDGVSLHGKSKAEKEAARTARFRVGMVFQYPEHQLFEETVYEDIAFGPRNQGLTDENVAARVKEAMELVHLSDGYRDRSPFALSGGERRRVAIAGVLALAPRYLVLDEPAAGLDPRGREELLAMLTMLHRERGVSIVLVSHSMEDILRVADHMVILAGGREASLNMRAAFLEVANDALGSLAVIVAAFVLTCSGLAIGALVGLVSAAPATAVAQVSADTTTTVVRPGQSLWDIAEASGTSDVPGMVARIAELNDLKGTTIRAGQTLEIPAV